ncbi:hypothetical protein [Acinetobacter sp.]|uniref:hypothetical protein n=1 Tax=Acinetobacter sp. TaxID=472 RepID=UPI00388E046A
MAQLGALCISNLCATKPFKSNLNESELQEWFEILCFISKNENKLVFDSRQDLLECIKKSISKKFQKENPSALLEDISKNLCLIIRDGNNYSFIHRSIQEFFVASFFKKRPQNLAEQTYRILDEKGKKYKSEIRFLSEIDSYRYKKYLLKPSLESFFKIYPNLQCFKNSLHVSLVQGYDNYHLEADLDSLGESAKYVEATISMVDTTETLDDKHSNYLYHLLHHHLISCGEASDAIFDSLRNYGVNRFMQIMPILKHEIETNKVSRFFRNENSSLIENLYKKFEKQLQECEFEIDNQEDQSFLDLI